MKKIFIPIVIFIAIGFNAVAGSAGIPPEKKTSKELKGDKYAFRYAYDDAIDSYSHAKYLTLEGQRRLAESYHNIGKNIESEVVYAKLITANEGILPEDYYNYAMVLKNNGKYDQATIQMNKFQELKPNDLRAMSYASNKAGLSDLLKDDGKYTIQHLNFNTDADDLGTSYYKNKIVFSSTRADVKMIKRTYNWNGKPFLNIYAAEVADGQFKNPKIFDKSLNSKMHDGPASFSNNGNYMAFSMNTNHDKTKDKIVELQIFFSSYSNENWSEPEPFAFNNPEYSVGHPCLTSDGNTIYFTSDMPGGFGGTDIYKTTKNGKEWSKPENMGDKINTEGDELFPFYEEKNEVLFFTSNGRFGLGGMDIFICMMNGSKSGKVYNAGAPLNTQYDDLSVIADSTLSKGYFTSNRVNGSGGDDIYSVEFLKLDIGKKIKGFAKDNSGNILSKTLVTLFDDKNNVIDTATTKDDGAFAFLVDSNKNFKLTGKKQNYIDGDSTANTFGKELIVKADVILLTKEEIIVKKIQPKADLGKVLELNPIYFDFHEYNIRPDAEIELAKIIKIMNEYPNMVVELGSYTDCRASEQYNQVLANKRAKASADYIKQRITKPSRISGKGYGETKLVNACSCEGNVISTCTEEDHQKNRRTEFIIIKK